MITNPKLILADEPTGNLDSKNGKEVMNLLTELNQEGTTVVMVTHSKHDASFAHRTIHLFDGSVVANIVEWKDYLKLNHVIQSEAKDLGNTHVYAPEILHYTSFRSEWQ